MANINCADFIAAYPEFGTVAQSAVETTLDLSSALWGESQLRKFYSSIVYLYAAHRLVLRYNLGPKMMAAGYRNPLEVGTSNNQSASNTSLAQGFVNSAMLTGENPWLADLARTVYGMELLSILYMIVPRGGLTA